MKKFILYVMLPIMVLLCLLTFLGWLVSNNHAGVAAFIAWVTVSGFAWAIAYNGTKVS